MTSTASRRRHSPAVYRRRRLAVLLAALLVVAGLVWLFVAQPWQGAAATAPVPSPSTSSPSPASPAPTATEASPAPDPTADAAPNPDPSPTAEACVPADLKVEALTDQSGYDPGQNPQLSIRLTNISAAGCTLNVGTSAQSFTISSGNDTWWRSTDCQTEPSDMIVLLAAGQEVTSSAPLTWDRTRSSVDTCQSERSQAPGGGATYHLSVAINGIASTSTAAFQLY